MSRDSAFERKALRMRASKDMTDDLGDSGVAQDAGHAVAQPRPALFLERELLSAGSGGRIEQRFAILLRRPPLRAQPAVLLHTMKRRIERPLFDPKQIARRLLNVRRDRIPVHPAVRAECLEHEQDECALEDVVFLFGHIPNYLYLTSYVKFDICTSSFWRPTLPVRSGSSRI